MTTEFVEKATFEKMTEAEKRTCAALEARFATVQANKQVVILDEQNVFLQRELLLREVAQRSAQRAPRARAAAPAEGTSKPKAKGKGGWPKGKKRGPKAVKVEEAPAALAEAAQ
jgi:hypothetical protein